MGTPWGPKEPQGAHGTLGPSWAQGNQGTLAKGTCYRCMHPHCMGWMRQVFCGAVARQVTPVGFSRLVASGTGD